MHFCHFSGNVSLFQNVFFFVWKTQSNSRELLEYRQIFDCANGVLTTWMSDSLTGSSPVSRACARVTPLRAIWLEFVEQHEDEHCPATKWLDDYADQMHNDKAPIVHRRLRHSRLDQILMNESFAVPKTEQHHFAMAKIWTRSLSRWQPLIASVRISKWHSLFIHGNNIVQKLTAWTTIQMKTRNFDSVSLLSLE